MIRFLPHTIAASLWVLAAWAWPRMPERMPVHWGIHGEVDRWGSRAEGVLLLPAVATAALLLFVVIPRFDPGRANFTQMRGPWIGVQTSILAVLAVTYGASLGLYPMGAALPFTLGGMFMLLGVFMGKIRPNYTLGVRTPWTLASKLSWTRTHRAAGFGFIGSGLLMFLAALYSPEAAFITLVATLPVLVIGLFVYSWLVWKQDPERIPPSGTTPASG